MTGGNALAVTLTAPVNAGSGNITITVIAPGSLSKTIVTIGVTIS